MFLSVGQLLATIIILMSIETAGSVIILRLHHHVPTSPPPRWARKLILDWLALALRMTGRRHAFHEEYTDLTLEKETLKADAHQTDDPFEFDQQNSIFNCQTLGVSLLQQLQLEGGSNGPKDSVEQGYMSDSDYGSDATDLSIGSTVQQIGGCIDRLVNRSKLQEKKSLIQQQWIDMCVILDRVLMALFAMAIIMTSLIILLKMTQSKPVES